MNAHRKFEFECTRTPDASEVPVSWKTFETDQVTFQEKGGLIEVTPIECEYCGFSDHSIEVEPENFLVLDSDTCESGSPLHSAVVSVFGEHSDIEIYEHIDPPQLEVVVPEAVLESSWISRGTLEQVFSHSAIWPAPITVSVDYDGESDPESVPSPSDVLRDNADMCEEKDEDYGASWRLAGKTMALWAQELDIDLDLQDEGDAISSGLYYQRLIKLIRAYNLEYGAEDPNNELPSESHRDGSNYGAIHAHHSLEREASSGE